MEPITKIQKKNMESPDETRSFEKGIQNTYVFAGTPNQQISFASPSRFQSYERISQIFST
jgi:hypothetical protein